MFQDSRTDNEDFFPLCPHGRECDSSELRHYLLSRHWSTLTAFAATFCSASFSTPNPVWFEKVTPQKCVRFSKTSMALVWREKILFARHRFPTQFRLVWKIFMTIVNGLKIPSHIQFGLEKSLTIANALNLKPIPVLSCKISFLKRENTQTCIFACILFYMSVLSWQRSC